MHAPQPAKPDYEPRGAYTFEVRETVVCSFGARGASDQGQKRREREREREEREYELKRRESYKRVRIEDKGELQSR